MIAAAEEPTAKPEATAAAPSDAEALAKKLSNPISSLISVPIQFNYDMNIGPGDDGSRFLTNVQPVIPISISQNWNMISRTIVPIIYQEDIGPNTGDQFGFGDIVQSLFFSPKAPSTFGQLIWGVGPVVLLPTATDDLLGAGKWGAGPTGVVLRQSGHFTYGALANHLWSFAGEGDRSDVNATFMQPFLSYTTKTAWTFGLNTEASYDWEGENWSVPINATVSKLVKVGKQPISLMGGLRYWAEAPDGGPEGLGFRAGITFLFPKK
jgi:hypothetical protein